MNATGKSARKRYGTKVAAKQAKKSRGRRKKFGQLPVSVSRGNTEQFIRSINLVPEVELTEEFA
jgi:hypothetical protein